MNVAKFVVLGALELIGEGSGYDIITELEKKKISRWTEVQKGSIYHALKKLGQDGAVQEVTKLKKGLYPEKTIYKSTDVGRSLFDTLQAEAFNGLYPKFYGFKLALKFNRRRSPKEIKAFGEKAINRIENTLKGMEAYLNSADLPGPQKEFDRFFIEHDRLLFEAEKYWIQQAIIRFGE